MNANELADAIETVIEKTGVTLIGNFNLKETGTMLRQQQAEIEALKMDIYSLTYGERIAKYFNKPVAWFEQDPDMKSIWYQSEQDNPNAIPLYTHPAKTLTDEEISDIRDKFLTPKNCDIYTFVRAILRKAQEK